MVNFCEVPSFEILPPSLGSLALVSDGVHMSTHATAFFISAMAYSYSKKKANDPRFVFGTGKVGELAAYSSALILFGVSIYIIVSSILRFIYPQSLDLVPSLIVSFVGLSVNVASGLFLSVKCGSKGIEIADGHCHDHGHAHSHGHSSLSLEEEEDCGAELDHGHSHAHDVENGLEHGHDHEESFELVTHLGSCTLSIYETGVPPVFRLKFDSRTVPLLPSNVALTTVRPDGSKQKFTFVSSSDIDYFHSVESIPEPHSFAAILNIDGKEYMAEFREHDEKNAKYHHDNNFRAALYHVVADAFVSVLVVIAIAIAGSVPSAWFLDPLVAIIGSLVIISWVYSLFIATVESLLDMSPDLNLNDRLKKRLESDGESHVTDLHVWRVGPGSLVAVISVYSKRPGRNQAYYAGKICKYKAIKHLTISVLH